MEISINGAVTTPDGIDVDQFTTEFLAFLESRGCYFGGGIGTYSENADEPKWFQENYKDNYHKD